MIEFIIIVAILVGFGGGVVGRAWRFEKKYQRFTAFLVPVTICAVLLHVPFLMPLLFDMLRFGLGPLNGETFRTLATAQLFILLAALLLTGTGWLCSLFVQAVFETEPE